jgi:DNA-binding GntR family transcriptional regulator
MHPKVVQHPWTRTKTVPEQIADQVAAKIISGERRGGERLGEQELATFYGVSRGPIREALRDLEKRGLVNIFPRRGAFVVDLTVDAVADIFNVRAALMGLAARYITLAQDPDVLAQLRKNVEELHRLCDRADVRPDEFVQVIWRLAAIVTLRCDNEHLTAILRNQLRQSAWGVLWGDEPLDYTTTERKREAASAYSTLLRAICEGDDQEAEARHRAILFRSRDQTIAVIEKLRRQQVQPRRKFQDRPRG